MNHQGLPPWLVPWYLQQVGMEVHGSFDPLHRLEPFHQGLGGSELGASKFVVPQNRGLQSISKVHPQLVLEAGDWLNFKQGALCAADVKDTVSS